MKWKFFGLMSVGMLMVVMGMTSPAIAQDNMGMRSNKMMMSSMDQKLMTMAAMGGMAEVEMARLALQKSGNDAVKQYAQKMIDDHMMAGDELKQLASMKGVTLPMQQDAKQMSMMAKMQKLSGMDFDRMYIKESGIKAHQNMVKLYMKESMSGRDMDAKAWATKTLPTVQMHLQMARDIMKSMGRGM
ncbi:MAG: DUF4142 domain-containing protein [Pyrinomonadaceae bacterium]